MVHAALVYQKSWITTCDENPCLNAFSIAEVILSVEFWLTKKQFYLLPPCGQTHQMHERHTLLLDQSFLK